MKDLCKKKGVNRLQLTMYKDLCKESNENSV